MAAIFISCTVSIPLQPHGRSWAPQADLCDTNLGVVIEMNKGDILGHEFCGVVDSVGPGVKGIEVGGRYVASFQIACGDVSNWSSGGPGNPAELTPSWMITLTLALLVFLLQTEIVIAVRKDQRQHRGEGHVRNPHGRHVRILTLHWRLRRRPGRVRTRSSGGCQFAAHPGRRT